MNRQKAHAALDALLDAIGEQAEEAPAAPRERRKRVLRHPEPPASYKPAAEWARRSHVPVESYPADWRRGKGAGPERNARMLAEGWPDLVVAFPGGRGTADMVRRAKAAGVRVVEVVEPVTAGGGE